MLIARSENIVKKLTNFSRPAIIAVKEPGTDEKRVKNLFCSFAPPISL